MAICAAFASHFAIDAIPHWDYPLRSISVAPGHRNSFALTGPLIRDLGFIALDTCAGLLSSLFLFATPATAATVALCAMAGMLPDLLQIVYGLWPRQPLATLQRFHRWVHSKRKLGTSLGVSSQIAFIMAFIAVADLLRP